MTPSDIIAIVAIVTSAIVSIVSAYISFQNNKANINARRSEIALEKRLEAFSEVTTKMGMFRLSLVNYFASQISQKSDKLDFAGFKETFVKDLIEFHLTVERVQVYLPRHISIAVDEFVDALSNYTDNFLEKDDLGDIDTLTNNLWQEELKVVKLMQEFVGLK